MLRRARFYAQDLRDRQRITLALAKGGAAMLKRNIDKELPHTWEFSGFSQNGEDGIIDVLRSQLEQRNRYVVEIGSADGIENNSSWLLLTEQYNGLLVDASVQHIATATRTIARYSIGAEYRAMFVTKENASEIVALAMHRDPDVLSLDIDGNDFYVAKTLIDEGLRPKIIVVEYNSAFGDHHSKTIRYHRDFRYTLAHPTHLYYGVSILGWRKLFDSHGYRFITVDRQGVNAFFADPGCFDPSFLQRVRALEFAENQFQLRKWRASWEQQYKLIEAMEFVSI